LTVELPEAGHGFHADHETHAVILAGSSRAFSATSFMDADVSILVRDTDEARQPRASFRQGKR
jgi:hypothetical protein